VLLRFPRALPMWLLDVLLIIADALLAALGIFEDSLKVALPGTFVVIGTILFAVRAWWIACVHVGLLGTSYALVLAFGDPSPGPVLRWISVMAAITSAGLFVRWLVDQTLALARDETAFRNAAEAATQELQRVSEMRSAFLARMSHELRTPLNVVLGFSDLLAEQVVGPLNDRQLEYTRDISSSARHQVELVDEVLDLAKVESGRSDLRTDEVDLRSVLGEAVRMVRDRAERKGLQLVLSVEPGLGLVLADRL
jgi:signal transduction histidine kinase